MFFILSKTLSLLAMPLVWVCLLLMGSWVLRNTQWKKRLLVTGVVLLLFFSNDFVANEAMRLWEIPVTPYDSISNVYEYGILLTGVTRNDLEPDDRVYFMHGADRVVHTAQLYQRGIIRNVIVSGGVGRIMTYGRPEADELKKVLIMLGVPEEAIILENQSRNTAESAAHVKVILEDAKTANALLITSAFHMRRSFACFRHVGLQLDTFSTDFYTHPRHFTPEALFVPKPDAVVVWQKLFKEWTGLLAYKIAGYI
jgi:uncharacterized SAM-binding protein YcdF (DUF218 family)